MAAGAGRLSRPARRHHVLHGHLGRAAAHPGVYHAVGLAARCRRQPHRHRLLQLGRADLRLQVPVVAAGRPAAASRAALPARPAPELGPAGHLRRDRRPDRHGADRPEERPVADGAVRLHRGVQQRDPGHRARRLPHRERPRPYAGRDRRRLSGRLHAGGQDRRRRARALSGGIYRLGHGLCRHGRLHAYRRRHHPDPAGTCGGPHRGDRRAAGEDSRRPPACAAAGRPPSPGSRPGSAPP